MSKVIDYRVDDGIATLTVNLEDRPMNVITPDFIEQLGELVDRVAGDDAVRGAIVTSSKDDFMAGADLKYVLGALGADPAPEEAYRLVRPYTETLRKLETCGKPFVAAVNGTALGGGLELALACHYRVAADNPRAVLGTPEVQVGLLPGAGGTQRLPRMIGIREALPLLAEGRHLKPAKAAELGIVNEVVPADELQAAARRRLDEGLDPEQPWDKKGFRVPGGSGAMHPKSMETFMVGSAMIADKTQHNYPAPISILSAVFEGTIVPMDAGLRIESRYFAALLIDPVARNMIRTLFVNKGAADKLVRRPKGVDKSAVTTLGVLGAGMMGAGVAYVSAMAGMDVVLLDTEMDNAEKGKDYSRGLLAKRLERGKISEDKSNAVLARIKTTTNYADLADCDLVVEAVFEHRDIKADVTKKTEAVIAESAVFASNTSTLPITGLAQASERPEKFIGIHFFSPVDKMPLVEIIVGEKTSDEAIARSLDYVRQLKKTPIVVNDSRGFYTSRVFSTFTNEGQTMLAEGVNPALIENAAKLAGMAIGPLAVSDEVSIELAHKVVSQHIKDLGEDHTPPSSWPVIRKFVEELDRKGKRHGKGFYDYPTDGKKRLWPGIADVYPRAEEQPTLDEVKTRLLYIQSLESARCLEEDVLTDPADGDIGSVFGWGFPAYTGGTLSMIDTLGIGKFVAECDRLADAYGERFRPSDWLRERAERGESFFGATPTSQAAA